MRLLVINKTIANKCKGFWKAHHELLPIEVKTDTHYILNLDAILRIKPNLNGDKYAEIRDNVTWFTVGDGSDLDIKYQEYLAAQALLAEEIN